MGTSSKRFIIIAIMLDILLAVFGMFALGGTGIDAYKTSYSASLENMTSDSKEQFESPTADTGQQYMTKTFGDSFTMGKVLGLLTRGINNQESISCPDCPDETSAGALAWVIGLFIIIINLLGLFELFMLTINKKTD